MASNPAPSAEESPLLCARALAAFALTQAEMMNPEAWKSYTEHEQFEANPVSYWNDIIRYARQQEEILLATRAEKAARLEKGAAWIERQAKMICALPVEERPDAYVSFFGGVQGFKETLAQHPLSRQLVHKTLQDAYADASFVHSSLSVGYELEKLLNEIVMRIDYSM